MNSHVFPFIKHSSVGFNNVFLFFSYETSKILLDLFLGILQLYREIDHFVHFWVLVGRLSAEIVSISLCLSCHFIGYIMIVFLFYIDIGCSGVTMYYSSPLTCSRDCRNEI